MKHYSFYGYKEFVLALGYKGDYIRNYFLNYYNYNSDFTIHLGRNGDVEIHNNTIKDEWSITLVETGEKSMTGFRVKLCSKYINEDRFMLTYGDAVSNVSIDKLVEFNIKQNTIGTVTGVYPPSRFGDLVINDDNVIKFKQQLKDTEHQSPINGGYFIFKREFFNHIPDDPNCDLEKAPIDSIVNANQLTVYRHEDFWQCMDTYRDYEYLNNLWINNPKWKIW
jgi:glucose-1-phosphate cytidylyltransferase